MAGELSETEINDRMEQADADRINGATRNRLDAGDKQRMAAIKRESRLKQVAGDLPDDVKALWMYAESSLTQAAVSTIDAGRALIKLKEKLPHGDFKEGLDIRGIPARTASNLARTAAKFADRSEKFLSLSRSKLYACLEFSDDELDALEGGQSVLDVDLDAIDRMTVRELKAAIKQRDKALEVKDGLLETKNKQIDSVAEENERLKGSLEGPSESATVQNIRQRGGEAEATLILLRGMANRLSQEGSGADATEVAALTGALDTVRNELALAYRLLENADPAFQACNELSGQEAWNPDAIDAVN